MSDSAIERAVALLGGQRGTARALSARGLPVAQAHVWYWINKSGRVPADVAVHLHCLTRGKVSREELRPDVFSLKCASK
jgi:DNA-binding transcriptional regulator YdaS (Cro superfamily)